MKVLTVDCHSLTELHKIAQTLLNFSGNHHVFALYGSMGAGKTTFIKAICDVLGVKEHVSSPTFSLINEYKYSNGKVFHFDFYRIKSETEAMDIGCEEYFYSNSFCFVEWPEKVIYLLPKERVEVFIEIRKDEQRSFKFKIK